MRHCSLLVILLLCCPLAPAQVKPEPPRRPTPSTEPGKRKDTAEVALPKIELPEYDITGKLTPGVASSGKLSGKGEGGLDPLEGFGLGRREDLLPEGAKLGAASEGFPALEAGRVTAGYGSFATPFFDASYSPPGSIDVAFRAGYTSSAGHLDHADYRRGYGSLGVGWSLGDEGAVLSQSHLSAKVAYSGGEYHPYGSITPSETRSVGRFQTALALEDLRWEEIHAGGALALSGTSLAEGSTSRQLRFGLSLLASREGTVNLEGGVDLSLSSYSAPRTAENPFYARLKLLAGTALTEGVMLRLGASGAVSRGSEGSSIGRIYPLASLTWEAAEALELFIRFEPNLGERTLDGLLRANPYVQNGSALLPEVSGTDLTAGADVTLGRPLRVRLVTRYQRLTNYLAFIDTLGVGLWDPWYEGTSSIVTLRGEVMWQMTEGDLFTGSLLSRVSKNLSTEERIPYLAPLRLEASYAHWFPFGLMVSSDLTVVGERSVDLHRSSSLESIVLLDLSAEYRILSGWRLIGRVDNIAGVKQVWWAGYVGLPRSGSLALSYSW